VQRWGKVEGRGTEGGRWEESKFTGDPELV